ncbi:MAG: UDP-N-acetylglucosamine 2-epimerase [Gammaproteobacteria bacterium]|nr:UDP-N-acetylglucosamine 2-epimerase [Gammaproteobacteria bacterium]
MLTRGRGNPNFSQVFFSELKIPEPRYSLEFGSLCLGAQTGRMLHAVEPSPVCEKPGWVVYGGTNSTLADRRNLRVAPVEAGLRSWSILDLVVLAGLAEELRNRYRRTVDPVLGDLARPLKSVRARDDAQGG